MDKLVAAADQFKSSGNVIGIKALGRGNINKSFLVKLDSEEGKHFVLQRVNTRVFKQPELLMRNMRTVTQHIRQRLQHAPLSAGRRWEVPHVLLTQDGQDHWTDADGSFWRAISFIEDARSFDAIDNNEQAREVGHALGMFHTLLGDLSPDLLADTLKGFHITPLYLTHYDDVLRKQQPVRSPEMDHCIQFISERRSLAAVLETAKAQGRLGLRIIHGDPKVSNIMMDNTTGQAVGIVDLDTVKPGLLHYDIGDCLRSGCNPLGEDTARWEDVRFDTGLCRAILQGYLPAARGSLTPNDFEYMYESVRLIAFELGLRFFTDHLEGNVYFNVDHPEQNLSRALVQFRLTESIESREAAIRSIIRDSR